MPVGVAGGAAAVRALGWTWRWIWNGAARPAVVAHVDVGEVERVEHQLHPGPGQRRVDLVEVAVQADRRGRGDGAPFPPSERLGEQAGRGGDGRPGGQEPGQRRHAGLGVDPLVVYLLDPGGE